MAAYRKHNWREACLISQLCHAAGLSEVAPKFHLGLVKICRLPLVPVLSPRPTEFQWSLVELLQKSRSRKAVNKSLRSVFHFCSLWVIQMNIELPTHLALLFYVQSVLNVLLFQILQILRYILLTLH
jgi:hypothetical protein